MKNKAKQRILIVDDERINIDILVDTLTPEYETFIAKNGYQALQRVAGHLPDLILLDIMMPEMDGFEVCRRLKSDATTRDIPVIFITALGDARDESIGLKAGAIDYLGKPINPVILKARVKNQLLLRAAMLELDRLNRMALDANPCTGLPGNNSIASAVTEALENKDPVSVVYVDLDFFKAFNDKYGFARGDAVIRFTAQAIKEALFDMGCTDAFVGHIGGDDYILILPSIHCQEICEEIIRRFDDGISRFYDEKDAATRSLQSINRLGEATLYPIMSTSLAGVDLSLRDFTRYLEVNDSCAEVKKSAKAMAGSCFLMDRRKR